MPRSIFAAWRDDLAPVGALREGALGHATTVHPLLAVFDELVWVRGVLKTLSDKRRHRTGLPKNARYSWTVFKPETPALLDLRELVEQRRVGLPIAVRESLAKATLALDHVKKGRRGRALILPA
jgi:reticulon-4-interacting protein 1, mitochondrial